MLARFFTNAKVTIAFALGILIGGAVVLPAYAVYQPYMRQSRGYLFQARTALQNAAPDKGGHRLNGLSDINAAINQVNAGLRYCNNNC